jgi:hypothetical protein
MRTRALPSPPWTTFAPRSPTGGSGRASAACGMRSSSKPARPFAGKISPIFGIRSAESAGAINDCDPARRGGAVTDPGSPALFLLRDHFPAEPRLTPRPGLCALAGSVPGPVTSTGLRERRPPNWSAAMALGLAAVISYGIVVQALASWSHQVKAAAHHKPVPTPTSELPSHRACPADRVSYWAAGSPPRSVPQRSRPARSALGPGVGGKRLTAIILAAFAG